MHTKALQYSTFDVSVGLTLVPRGFIVLSLCKVQYRSVRIPCYDKVPKVPYHKTLWQHYLTLKYLVGTSANLIRIETSTDLIPCPFGCCWSKDPSGGTLRPSPDCWSTSSALTTSTHNHRPSPSILLAFVVCSYQLKLAALTVLPVSRFSTRRPVSYTHLTLPTIYSV